MLTFFNLGGPTGRGRRQIRRVRGKHILSVISLYRQINNLKKIIYYRYPIFILFCRTRSTNKRVESPRQRSVAWKPIKNEQTMRESKNRNSNILQKRIGSKRSLHVSKPSEIDVLCWFS
jgi:hypothetical protein